jgi:hypothetical protein
VFAVTPPSRDDALLVFSQRADTGVDITAWNAHAVRFFATRIGLTKDRPTAGEAEFVIAPDAEPPGVRSAFARPSDPEDQALAEAADARAGHTGLALLARRCRTVWVVAREDERDRLALRLASILASILLGPILDSRAGELFGVKTARAKLEPRS